MPKTQFRPVNYLPLNKVDCLLMSLTETESNTACAVSLRSTISLKNYQQKVKCVQGYIHMFIRQSNNMDVMQMILFRDLVYNEDFIGFKVHKSFWQTQL